MCEEGLESGREGAEEMLDGREGGRDGQSDHRQNCGFSMCSIKTIKRKGGADVTSLVSAESDTRVMLFCKC